MYKINEIRLPLNYNESDFASILAKKLRIDKDKIEFVELSRLSIDARDKGDLHYKASFVFEANAFDYTKHKGVTTYSPEDLSVAKWQGGEGRTIVVGSGPSGLFAAIRLIESGAKVTIVERGYEMSKRQKAVDNLMKNGVLDAKSNIQFGEGGAGTFSDGKLNTGIKSKYIKLVLSTFHKFGANKNILYDARPHIGTDILSQVIVNMRNYFLSLGGEVLFETRFVDFECENGSIVSAQVESDGERYSIPCKRIVLAIGHSSRDTIRSLFGKKIEFKQKPFSLGYRIEHLQEDVNISQYGTSANAKLLPPADYHLVEHVGDRVVYSFCMCPGGVVVPAMSEEGTFVTNGMSYNSRSGVNSNSAILVSIATSDFPSSHPLAGVEMQEELEKRAYQKTGSYKATVQKVGDFLAGVPSTSLGRVKPTITPGYELGSVEDLMPDFVISALQTGIPKLARKLKCFADEDALLTGSETRSSAPYWVVRDNTMQIGIQGLYAIGEGAGFAGGIVSSAVEGLKCADIIIENSHI